LWLGDGGIERRLLEEVEHWRDMRRFMRDPKGICVVFCPMSDASIAGASALRDAINLAKLHCAGGTDPGLGSGSGHEAIRDLVRARQAAVRTLSGVVIGVMPGRLRTIRSNHQAR
jgi:hypothetical protein